MARSVLTSPSFPNFDQPILVNVLWETASGLTGVDHSKPQPEQSTVLQAEGLQPSLSLSQMKHINPPTNQVAGRLQYFVDNWKIITSDKTILETVQGYRVPFISRPFQWRRRITKPKSSEKNLFLEAIEDLLAKGAIKETLPVADRFLSTVFLVLSSRAKLEPFSTSKR